MNINRIFFSLETMMLPMAARIAAQRHIMAIRDGFVTVMPFMIIGSFVLIFAYPPFAEGNSFFWLGDGCGLPQNINSNY